MSALAGKRILVTRPRAQAAALCDLLAERGAEPILFSTIEIAPLDDYAVLDEAIQRLDDYTWLVFTSANAVNAFWARLNRLGAALPPTLRVAAIGPATAQALDHRSVVAAFVPGEHVGEAVAAGLDDVAGRRVLLPRAEIAREALAIELRRRGAIVHEVAAYRTLPAVPDADGLRELQRGVDAITFTSSSTVQNFVALLSGVPIPSLGRAAIACIGPITAQTARAAGLPVDVAAAEFTTAALVDALDAYFAQPDRAIKENR